MSGGGCYFACCCAVLYLLVQSTSTGELEILSDPPSCCRFPQYTHILILVYLSISKLTIHTKYMLRLVGNVLYKISLYPVESHRRKIVHNTGISC